MLSKNLFTDIPADLPAEVVDTLLSAGALRVERIVSHGHASPAGFWYDQEQAEWVVVLSGHAKLLFADEAAPVNLRPGDHVNIPAHRRHRVEWTTAEEPTIWLAIYYG